MGKFNSSWVTLYQNLVVEETKDGTGTIGHDGKQRIMIERPLIVCLIGSSRFKEDHMKAQGLLTLEEKIVLPMELFGHLDTLPDGSRMDMGGSVKAMLDRLHFHKIDLADEVYVVNPHCFICPKCNKVGTTREIPSCGCKVSSDDMINNIKPYIGESTTRELAYSKSRGKTITYLNPPCNYCGGTGTVNTYWHPCDELREYGPCVRCEGKGYLRPDGGCPSSEIVCKRCNGKGIDLLYEPGVGNREVTCPMCKGKGGLLPYEPGLFNASCDECNGTGKVSSQETTVCPQCKGAKRIPSDDGWNVKDRCPTCEGRGKVSTSKV